MQIKHCLIGHTAFLLLTCSNHVRIPHHFQHITTFSVYVTTCDFDNSYSLVLTVIIIGPEQCSHKHTHTTVLWPFFCDHPGEPVPEENFWTFWCKGRLREADTPTIRMGATPSGLSSAHLHLPFFTDRMPFLLPNQQCQSTEGNQRIRIREKTLEFSSTVLPARFCTVPNCSI